MSKKPLRSQARNIIFNVYQRIIIDEQGAEQTQSILSHVQALTGVLRRIVAEGRSNRGVFSTPDKKKKGGKNTASSSSSSSDEDFYGCAVFGTIFKF
ncbi:uncharacterized protein LOC114253120 [Bombyx mandarina]|uniref:Uncharacterized protein LOC114253120 n=1 Tax=Bombyx mandarina TaxID=7092 RepID=A0A6J2KMZ7_BOMMA|nr:uncharacterized protein LOC114253120 [Bombyx mandarina]